MKIIEIILCLVLASAAFILSCLQFMEKGIPLNNSYLYASAEERSKMNKKPYYCQSGIVLGITGIIFSLLAIQLITGWNWIFRFVIAIIFIMLAYTVMSSIKNQGN